MLRTLTLLVLLITLPLRLWAAESMGFQPGQPASLSMQAFGTATEVMMDDCPMMNNQAATGLHGSQSKYGKSSCKACQLCMAFGFSQTGILFFPSIPPSLNPEVRAKTIVSADLAHLSKPPIS